MVLPLPLPLLQALHPLAQFFHHPQGLVVEPLHSPRPEEGKGGPHGPAPPAMGPPQRSGQFGAQARVVAIELLLQAEGRVPPLAPQLLDQPPQAPRRSHPQARPARMAGHRLAPALRLLLGEARRRPRGHPSGALAALMLQLLAQGPHLPAQGLVFGQQALHVGCDRPVAGGGPPTAGIKTHPSRNANASPF